MKQLRKLCSIWSCLQIIWSQLCSPHDSMWLFRWKTRGWSWCKTKNPAQWKHFLFLWNKDHFTMDRLHIPLTFTGRVDYRSFISRSKHTSSVSLKHQLLFDQLSYQHWQVFILCQYESMWYVRTLRRSLSAVQHNLYWLENPLEKRSWLPRMKTDWITEWNLNRTDRTMNHAEPKTSPNPPEVRQSHQQRTLEAEVCEAASACWRAAGF